MIDRHAAEDLLGTYLTACERRDVTAIVQCFAPLAVVMDPTSPMAQGRDQIGTYFRALYDDLADLKLQSSPLYWQADAIACHWKGVARRHNGDVISYEGIDVFELTDGPLIARILIQPLYLRVPALVRQEAEHFRNQQGIVQLLLERTFLHWQHTHDRRAQRPEDPLVRVQPRSGHGLAQLSCPWSALAICAGDHRHAQHRPGRSVCG